MRVLLTNDDGIEAAGLRALHLALCAQPGLEVVVIAPDGNRSATARMITTRRPLAVEEVEMDDGSIGYATDGSPVDCVRFAWLGLVDGKQPDVIVSGINHGSNLGEDITYSGTVGAAFEGLVLGMPAVAVSQQSKAGTLDYRGAGGFDFTAAARFTARLVAELTDHPLPEGTLLNLNVPCDPPSGVEVCALGKRIYDDELRLLEREGPRSVYRIYGMAPHHHDKPGTDLSAVAAGKIAVTPIHLDLTRHGELDTLAQRGLEALLEPAEGQA